MYDRCRRGLPTPLKLSILYTPLVQVDSMKRYERFDPDSNSGRSTPGLHVVRRIFIVVVHCENMCDKIGFRRVFEGFLKYSPFPM